MNFSDLPLFLSRKGFLYPILGVLVALTITTYYHRYPTGDDAWIAEQSYWLSKEGVVRSEFFRGILGWEKQLFVTHKLFVAFGALLIKLSGYQLPTVQFTSLTFFCILLVALVAYMVKKEGKLNSPYILAILILVFSNRFLIRISFENRPEVMVTTLGFCSFICLTNTRNKLFRACLAGFLAGLALLTHLNGVIYLLAGFGLLAYRREFAAAFFFAVVGGLTGLLYFIDVFMVADGFSTWYYQFTHDPATQDAFSLKSKLLVMLTYPRLFFYTPEHAALSILFVYIAWHQRKFVRSLPVDLKVYSLVLLISFWILTKHPSGGYLSLFMPFMLLIIYELYKRSPFSNSGLKLTLALYFLIGLYGIIEIIYINNSRDYLPTAYKKLRPYISAKESGLVPLTFFFNEYEQYAHLLCYENATYLSKQTANPANEIATWAASRDVDFIVMDYVHGPAPYYPPAGTTQLPSYKLTFFDGRFAVYKYQLSKTGNQSR